MNYLVVGVGNRTNGPGATTPRAVSVSAGRGVGTDDVKAPQTPCDAGAARHHPLAAERGHEPDNGGVRDSEKTGEISERRGIPVVDREPLDSGERFGLSGSRPVESIFGSGHVKASGGGESGGDSGPAGDTL